MRHTILFFSILLAAGLAHAREGFHMGLGGGFSSLNGDDACEGRLVHVHQKRQKNLIHRDINSVHIEF